MQCRKKIYFLAWGMTVVEERKTSIIESHLAKRMEKVEKAPALKVFDYDPYLVPFGGSLVSRNERFRDWVEKIEAAEGLDAFTRSYEKMGFSVDEKSKTIMYREWAPNPEIKEAFLIGDFNEWNRSSHRLERDSYGVWSITLKADSSTGDFAIAHGTKVKISLVRNDGERLERVPAWITRCEQDQSKSLCYEGVFWNPSPNLRYQFKHTWPMPKPDRLRIYEAHVGICSPQGKIASYNEFREQVLPRIHKLGYNAIQLMAIMEHAYYASFGYQVTNFFSVSSRYGTPEELMQLIDEAHSYGIVVLLDVVHSHACKNVLDGLNMFDGSDHCYFHEGAKGRHELWDSRLFNYGNWEVLRFLLSNLRFFMDKYHFDGFRFDGVTSMMYKHHGIGYGFSGDYREYFTDLADDEAINYLILANHVIHRFYPNAITIAEDVSGMPTLCTGIEDGGMGFDYRLAMAIPDMWIRILKETRDEDWDMHFIAHTLTNRRYREKTVAYAESHDQALVGDKTLAFWLMDKEMYDFMSDLSPLTGVIDRGLSLHKMIRLLTMGLGGEAYLNFMGNEFGHPEWLDFPRSGNNNSYHYARRQYNLVDDPLLRYKYLYAFDAAMNGTEANVNDGHGWLSSPQAYISLKHEGDKVIAFERGGLVFIFNFHCHKSYDNYRVGVDIPGCYQIALNTDDRSFGGHGRIDHCCRYFSKAESWCNRSNYIQVYIPCRTALVLTLTCD